MLLFNNPSMWVWIHECGYGRWSFSLHVFFQSKYKHHKTILRPQKHNLRPKTDWVFPRCGNGILLIWVLNFPNHFHFQFHTSMFTPWNRCGIALSHLFPKILGNISRLKSVWNIPRCETFLSCFHFHGVCLRCGIIRMWKISKYIFSKVSNRKHTESC